MEYDVSMGYYLNRHVDVTMAKKEEERKKKKIAFLLIILEENEGKATKEDSDILTLFF